MYISRETWDDEEDEEDVYDAPPPEETGSYLPMNNCKF